MKGGKRHVKEGMELPNQEKIRTLVLKETYKYLGILETDTIKQVELKEKIKKSTSQEIVKATRNQTKGINIWAISLRKIRRTIL